MKSSKADLEKALKALAGAGPVGLAKLQSATGRNLRTIQRWAKRDPDFQKLLSPLLLRDRDGADPDEVADESVQRPPDARLVELYAAEAERRLQAEIKKGQAEQDLLSALRKLKDCDLLIDHQRSRIAELEAKLSGPVTPLRVIRGDKE